MKFINLMYTHIHTYCFICYMQCIHGCKSIHTYDYRLFHLHLFLLNSSLYTYDILNSNRFHWRPWSFFRIGLTFVNTTTIAPPTFHAGGRRTDLAPCRREVSSVKVKVVKVATWKIIGVLLMMLKSPKKKNTCHFFVGGEWPEHRYMLWKMSCGSVPSIDRAFHGLPCQSVSKLSLYVVFVSQTWWANAAQKCLRKARMSIQFKAKCFIKSQDVWI